MRVSFAAAVCTWGYLACAGAPAYAAEITDLASSFEKGKPFGFKFGATYTYTFKTASITRESLPLLQSAQSRKDLNTHFGIPNGQDLQRTEIVPDLLYTQRRQSVLLDLAIGLYQDLQLRIAAPLILRDERQYDLDRNAGFNTCRPDDVNLYSCVASSSSTVLDGIYPVQPSDLAGRGATIFSPPVRGGTGKSLVDTVNISLSGAPVSQRRDPTKPTWVLGFEAQVSIGEIMQYDNTQRYLAGGTGGGSQALLDMSKALNPSGQGGWTGVSDGLHKFIFSTALSHKFKYVDPYLGLYYQLPLARTNDDAGSPWKTDYGFAQKRSAPQQQAGIKFGFEATPLHQKEKGHRLALDFRGGLDFHFLGRGYSEAWELLASSNALVCDDQTALPPPFTFRDMAGRPGTDNAVTQGYYNPACRVPVPTGGGTDPAPGYTQPRLPDNAAGSRYFQKPYTGVTLIENYLTFNAELGVVIELFKHMRIRLAAHYLRDQGHVITQDDAGTTSYPDNNRVQLNNQLNGNRGCEVTRVDLKCPFDWNPAYRAVVNFPGRRYRVDDINVISGSAMLQAFW